MNTWLGLGSVFVLLLVAFVVARWPAKRLSGAYPASSMVFIAILFTSGLDVGLIMFPLTEFPIYANHQDNPEYRFTNPIAIAFGFWGFLVWAIYFLTCFYFCAIEPKVRFFEKKWVNLLNSLVVIGTCAFTGYLLLSNLSWYLPGLAQSTNASLYFAAIVGFCIVVAVYSSTELKYVKLLSVSSSSLFLLLIAGMAMFGWLQPQVDASHFAASFAQIGGYFANIEQFVLPINDYHAFYLAWWFAWSIMIGQFSARFVGNMPTWKMLAHMLVWPSLSIGLWFSVLYVYFQQGIAVAGTINVVMVIVGVVFVINSLDSLLRLYVDNLQLTPTRLGKKRYFLLHSATLAVLVALFNLDFLQIEWIGAFVIAVMLYCTGYVIVRLRAAQQLSSSNSTSVE